MNGGVWAQADVARRETRPKTPRRPRLVGHQPRHATLVMLASSTRYFAVYQRMNTAPKTPPNKTTRGCTGSTILRRRTIACVLAPTLFHLSRCRPASTVLHGHGQAQRCSTAASYIYTRLPCTSTPPPSLLQRQGSKTHAPKPYHTIPYPPSSSNTKPNQNETKTKRNQTKNQNYTKKTDTTTTKLTSPPPSLP